MPGDSSLLWRRLTRTRVQRCRVFDLDRVQFQREADKKTRDFWVVDCPDWVNVIALTPERRVVLVRQFRVGIDDLTPEKLSL